MTSRSCSPALSPPLLPIIGMPDAVFISSPAAPTCTPRLPCWPGARPSPSAPNPYAGPERRGLGVKGHPVRWTQHLRLFPPPSSATSPTPLCFPSRVSEGEGERGWGERGSRECTSDSLHSVTRILSPFITPPCPTPLHHRSGDDDVRDLGELAWRGSPTTDGYHVTMRPAGRGMRRYSPVSDVWRYSIVDQVQGTSEREGGKDISLGEVEVFISILKSSFPIPLPPQGVGILAHHRY